MYLSPGDHQLSGCGPDSDNAAARKARKASFTPASTGFFTLPIGKLEWGMRE